jgi:hypothetical protein
MKIFNNILDRFSPQNSRDTESDAMLLALVRIGLGIIVAWRSFFIATDALYYFEESELLGVRLVWKSAGGWLFFLSGFMLAFGLWTRLTSLLLMTGHAAFSIWTSTYNLGPMLMVPMFGGLAILNAGCVWSIDAWQGRSGVLPNQRDRQIVGLLLFTFNAILHFSAVIFHLKDTNWKAGKTFALILTNSYLSSYFEFFRYYEANYPMVWQTLSCNVVLFQTFFQLGMLPLIFLRWGRGVVKYYGLLFTMFSLLGGIHLSILPVVEMLLWIWIFLPSAWIPSLFGLKLSEFRCNIIKQSTKKVRIFFLGYCFLFFIFIFNEFITQIFDRSLPKWLSRYTLGLSGLIAPNVFNLDDLIMGDNWPVIYRLHGGEFVMLPFNGRDGVRLFWHQSDLIYYSVSRPLRIYACRLREGKKLNNFSTGVSGLLIQKLVRFDYLKTRAKGPVFYKVEIYSNSGSFPEVGNLSRYEPKLIYKQIINVDL